MEKTKSLRALLVTQSFVPLEQDQEGKLRGGFAALSSKGLNNCNCNNAPNNCTCNGNNCGCPPSMTNNCTCNDSKDVSNNCDCYSTTKPPVTAAPSSESTASTTGVSMSGYWPGLM